MRQLASILCATAVLAASPAVATERRVAVLVANPFGGDDLLPLRYTGNDLERMREVLERWGGFSPRDILVSYGEDADTVLMRFDEAQQRLSSAGSADTLFLFYFSGHAKDGELRLGDTRLPLADVKRLTEASGATTQLALIDACRSGGITRSKGAHKGAPIEVAFEEPESQSGQVVITASSEHEDAQESDAVQGSFFTYFFTTGLRGAADTNADGKVSLAEAYQHAYNSTVLSTLGSRGGVQHPTYHFDLRGAGELVLTRLSKEASSIVFPEDAAGHFVVFDLDHKVVVAELTKEAAHPLHLAVAPGAYVVKKRETDHLRMQRLQVPKAGAARVETAKMEQVAFADDYAKGAVVTLDDVRYGKVGMSLAAATGAQSFLSTPAKHAYFPDIGLLMLQLDVTNALRNGMGLRFDVGVGNSGRRNLRLSDPYLGEQRYAIRLGQFSLGAALTSEWSLWRWLRVGGEVRLGLVVISRTFLGSALPEQTFSTLTPGVGAEATVALNSWLSAGLSARVHYMFFNVDAPMSLAFVDGALVLRAVLQ